MARGSPPSTRTPEEKLARYHNPKYPQDYIQRIDTILRQKDEIFALLEEQNA